MEKKINVQSDEGERRLVACPFDCTNGLYPMGDAIGEGIEWKECPVHHPSNIVPLEDLNPFTAEGAAAIIGRASKAIYGINPYEKK